MTENFGAYLREARERKGITLRQIATATKISVAALDSLERGDFSKLPGGIFSRAFVRSYATEVGLDPDETVHRFLEVFEGEHPAGAAPEPGRALHPVSQPSATPQALDLTPEFDFESKQRMAGVVLKLVVVSLPIAAAILYFSSRASTPSREAETPVQAPQSGAMPVETPHPAPAVQSFTPPAAPASTPMTIELAPSGDCWAQLTTDGTVVLSRVLKAGERESRGFRDVAVLHVGDAAACTILINGRPARPLGPPRKVRQVRITPDNYTTFLP